MSSRLILLPKKSYTPWNPQNVARVERDEQLAAEKAEKEREDLAKRQSGISALQTQQAKQNHSKNKHVNLFEQEEEDAMHKLVHGSNKLNDKKNSSILKDGVDYLGGTELKRRRREQEQSSSDCAGPKNHHEDSSDEVPIYKRNNNSKRRHRSNKLMTMLHDQKLKERMDPMSQFCKEESSSREYYAVPESAVKGEANEPSPLLSSGSSTSSHERRRKKKHKRKKSHHPSKKKRRKSRDSSSSSSKGQTRDVDVDHPAHPPLEELRKKRLERERKERRRSGVVEVRSIEKNDNNGRRRYLDQYNPGLSRR